MFSNPQSYCKNVTLIKTKKTISTKAKLNISYRKTNIVKHLVTALLIFSKEQNSVLKPD